MSVRWLLEVYAQLSALGRNFMVVPVMVSYDRIYESGNLATEMIEGEKVDYPFYTSLEKIFKTSHNSLGHIYVKYLDPINIEEYVQTNCDGRLCQGNLDTAALKLTTDLIER